MAFLDPLYRLIGKLFVEWPVRKKTIDDLIDDLTTTAQTEQARLDATADTSRNREIIRHIIGMERWGQRRLQVALGQPFVRDESDQYYPNGDADLPALRQIFQETRDQTIALARQLKERGAGDVLVPHNEYGEFSIRGWLYYLNGHVTKESKTLKEK
jgi:hypothetical protein